MSASADRNLLFGILAVQLDFVTRDQLVAGMNAWLLDKARPLGDVLRDQGHLSADELQHLAALVEVHLRRHGDPQRSLAALSSVPPTLKQQLVALPDETVQQSIAYVGAVPPPTSDPVPTRPSPNHCRLPRRCGIASCGRTPGAGWARCSWPRTPNSAGRWR